MNSFTGRIAKHPVILLITLNLVVGLVTHRNYGLSWDEPLFYDYGDALGYAYSPAEWFSGSFDLENSYGPSADDHKTRGPAYLFLARNFVYAFEALGADPASAWHLVNFLFFQLGVYFLYRLATRWISPLAALAAAAFFSCQPVLWGHAFVNPKDPPFLTFFLASVCLGFELMDALREDRRGNTGLMIAAAFALGIATSIRVIGPLAGALVIVYGGFALHSMASISRPMNTPASSRSKFFKWCAGYAGFAILFMIATWPYLWENPFTRFIEVLRFMSDNPTQLSVLFNGEVFRADDMPRRYLPFMLGATLTEPAWVLFTMGIAAAYMNDFRDRWKSPHAVSLALTLVWFGLVVLYVILRKPAVYDGLRHFLFILPPVFIFCGLAIQWLAKVIQNIWLRAGMFALILLPGITGILRLHPYEYAYYNSFVGGTSGAFRSYETDYWLTCYREAVETFEEKIDGPVNLFVRREPYIAEYYAGESMSVRSLRDSFTDVQPGDYILVNTRTNEDRSTFREAPPVLQVIRGDAVFCVIKQAP